LARHEEALLRQYAAMSQSDDPELRSAGKRRLREIAARSSQTIAASVQRKGASRKPREKSRNPIREKIIKVMRRARRDADLRFMDFLLEWLGGLGDSDRLGLREAGDSYEILDDVTGDECTYKLNSLQNLWAKAGRRAR
jgi:hypothetical protein